MYQEIIICWNQISLIILFVSFDSSEILGCRMEFLADRKLGIAIGSVDNGTLTL